ncbi:CHASE domain-containing protein [Massilia sp. B-10]|nr:CHASE domain-containing protein [Massilia sp. B-10]
MRNDRSVDPRGYPEFDILPSGRRDGYTVLHYIGTDGTAARAHGLDIGADPARRALLDLGRDTGKLGASGLPVMLTHPKPHIGLGMRLPVYRTGAPLGSVAERRAAYLGSAGIGFSVAALVQGALDEIDWGEIDVAVFADGGSAPPRDRGLNDRLLVGGAASAGEGYFETVLPVDFNGSLWKTRFRVRKEAMTTSLGHIFPAVAGLTGFSGMMLLSAFL